MTWPHLALLLLTYDRYDYAAATLRAALDRIRYSGSISVHIADDGSSEDYRRGLVELAGGYDHVHGVGVTNAERSGYGASYNLATQAIHLYAGVVLSLEDDWVLNRDIDLDPLVAVLTDPDAGVGCIRMGYLGFTQPLRGELRHIAGGTYLELAESSPEPHVWAGHPRLETVAWQRKVGPWPEHLDPGSTEFAVAQRDAARRGVVWPLDLIRGYGDLWSHIGAVQARGDQR